MAMTPNVNVNKSSSNHSMPRLLSPSIRKTANTVVLSPSSSSTAITNRKDNSNNVSRPFTSSSSNFGSTSQRLTSAAGSIVPLSNETEINSPVFKSSRAKKLFTQFDSNRDGFLSHSEFDSGLRSFISSMPVLNDLDITLTPSASTIDENGETKISFSQSQLDALFKEADHNNDGKLSAIEFIWRFGGGAEPVNEIKKPTRIIQIIKRQVKDANKISVEDVRAVLENVYDGPKVRYKSVDLTKIEQVSNSGLKRILMQTLQAEKEESIANKRLMEDWAQHIFKLNGLSQKDVDKLFLTIDNKKTGRIDLGPIFAQCQLKPSRHNNKNKKNKKNLNPGYLLTTIQSEHCRDFINDCIFNYCLTYGQTTNKLHVINTYNYPYRCHPPLDHWGSDDRQLKSLNSKQSGGYKIFLFLSERTKIRTMIKKLSGGFEIYAVFRTELTELKRSEYFYHCKIELNENEEFVSLLPILKRSWRDGEIEIANENNQEIQSWKEFCGEDEQELSIPPLTANINNNSNNNNNNNSGKDEGNSETLKTSVIPSTTNLISSTPVSPRVGIISTDSTL